MRSILAGACLVSVALLATVNAGLAAPPMYDVNAMFNEPHPFEQGGSSSGAGHSLTPAPQYRPPQYEAPHYSPQGYSSPGYVSDSTQPLHYRAPQQPAAVSAASRAPVPERPARAMRALSPWYVDFGLGFVVVADADVSQGGTTGELSADHGVGGSLAVGYRWRENVRFDLELAYRDSDLDRIEVGGFGFTGSADVDGSVSSLSGMINGYYDVDFGWLVTPYVGAGVGMAQVTVDSSTLSVDESDTVLAYQGILGLSYEISPALAARLSYKLFMTSDPEWGNTEGEYTANSVELGLSYRF
ncbi:MAG: outer membrane beta-barrel protein [Acetobacterales bacterium]